MSGLKRTLIITLIVLALVMAFVAGTMAAAGSPAAAPEAPQALTPGQWAAVQTSNWLMTTRLEDYAAYLPIVVRH
jgi:hypothetical protein